MSVQAATRVDWRALWASGDLFRFCFVSLGILLHATNETMIATIMPAMVGDLSGVAAGRLVACRLRARRDHRRCRGRPAGQLRAAAFQHGGRRLALRGRRADLRGSTIHARLPVRPPGRGARRRRAGLAGLRLGRTAVRARHLAAAVRRHVGGLGRLGLRRSAVRRAGRRRAVLALGVRAVLDRRLRDGGGELPGADRQRRARRSPLGGPAAAVSRWRRSPASPLR